MADKPEVRLEAIIDLAIEQLCEETGATFRREDHGHYTLTHKEAWGGDLLVGNGANAYLALLALKDAHRFWVEQRAKREACN